MRDLQLMSVVAPERPVLGLRADNFHTHALARASNRSADGLKRHVWSVLLLLLSNVKNVPGRNLCCCYMPRPLTATFDVGSLLDEVGHRRRLHDLHIKFSRHSSHSWS